MRAALLSVIGATLAFAACAKVHGQSAAEATDPPPPPVTLVVDAGPTLSVLGHHNGASRLGTYVEPGFSRSAISTLHRDLSFDGALTGNVHAQPLFVPDGVYGKGTFYVVTEANDVIAFDEQTGSVVWRQNFGPPADNENPACISTFTPIGITGTPAIDVLTRTIYLDSTMSMGNAPNRYTATHLIHALSIDTGAERDGWPIDPSGTYSNGHVFDSTVQHQRGALLISGGMLYVPYGSLADCGEYHGWLFAIPLNDPARRTAYSTPGLASGMWAPNGPAADEINIFVATGNSSDPEGQWAGGEALLRFPVGVPLPQTPSDVFATAGWHDLDLQDLDFGASGVLLIDMPSSTPSRLALVPGKDGFTYLFDRNNLGGLADGGPEGVAKYKTITRNIATAPAAFTTQRGTFVALEAQTNGLGAACPNGQGGDLVVVRILDGSPPTVQTVWCAQNQGHGSPMVTTTDGGSDAILWIVADLTNRLHAYDAETGELLFDGGDDSQQVTGADRFNTLIAVHDRVVIAANNQLYAFKP